MKPLIPLLLLLTGCSTSKESNHAYFIAFQYAAQAGTNVVQGVSHVILTRKEPIADYRFASEVRSNVLASATNVLDINIVDVSKVK